MDGVAINGVSGGPAFHVTGVEEMPVLIMGVVSAYVPNRATGETLPGLSVVRDVAQFHELAPTFASLDQAKSAESPQDLLPYLKKSRLMKFLHDVPSKLPQRPGLTSAWRRLANRSRLTRGADMICIANDCAKSTYKTTFHQLLAQSLSKSSDFMICELYANHPV